jgi:putative phage-type endonuclease
VSVIPFRAVTLGGSDAAAACGVDPYRSRVMLWLEKTGRVERVVGEAARWGTLLQHVIMEALAHDGYAIEQPLDVMQETYNGVQDPERAWLKGHPDGFLALGDEWATERAVLEIKTAGAWAHRANGAIPAPYQVQCQVYMHLTGLHRALLAVLVGGQRLELHELERDAHQVELILALMADFYRYVEADELPAPDGSESARDALGLYYPETQVGKLVRADKTTEKLVIELRARKEQKDAIGEQIRELENRLKAWIGDADTLVSRSDVKLATWRNVVSTRLDQTRLKAEAPHVFAQYAVTSDTRRLTLA